MKIYEVATFAVLGSLIAWLVFMLKRGKIRVTQIIAEDNSEEINACQYVLLVGDKQVAPVFQNLEEATEELKRIKGEYWKQLNNDDIDAITYSKRAQIWIHLAEENHYGYKKEEKRC